MNTQPRTIVLDPELTPRLPWGLSGELTVAAKAVPGAGQNHVPTRPLQGWATTYATILDDGTLQPVVDREQQVFEAAGRLEAIDWSGYLNGGLWNDTHRAPLPGGEMPDAAMGQSTRYVGVPTMLEFCGAEHYIGQQQRRVGWFTAGHLWDRDDPSSWELYTDHVPTEEELARADEFWRLAQLRAELGTALGFSVHGYMWVSRCKRRILQAQINGLAVCETPANPACPAMPVELAIAAKAVPEVVIGSADVADEVRPCGRCSCPAGVCGTILRKAIDDSVVSGRTNDIGPARTEYTLHQEAMQSMAACDTDEDFDRVIDELVRIFNVTPTAARALLLATVCAPAGEHHV